MVTYTFTGIIAGKKEEKSQQRLVQGLVQVFVQRSRQSWYYADFSFKLHFFFFYSIKVGNIASC